MWSPKDDDDDTTTPSPAGAGTLHTVSAQDAEGGDDEWDSGPSTDDDGSDEEAGYGYGV